MLTRALQRGTTFTVLAILIFGLYGRAMAHANLVSSVPAAGATVAAPTEVVITFSELLDPAGSSIVVMDSAGATVSEGTATVLANDNTTMRVALRTGLAAGQYTVQWNSRSAADGDDAQGDFTFTLHGRCSRGGSSHDVTPAGHGRRHRHTARAARAGCDAHGCRLRTAPGTTGLTWRVTFR